MSKSGRDWLVSTVTPILSDQWFWSWVHLYHHLSTFMQKNCLGIS